MGLNLFSMAPMVRVDLVSVGDAAELLVGALAPVAGAAVVLVVDFFAELLHAPAPSKTAVTVARTQKRRFITSPPALLVTLRCSCATGDATAGMSN
jgi:hypothetical protein